jgi:hypothetical protein
MAHRESCRQSGAALSHHRLRRSARSGLVVAGLALLVPARLWASPAFEGIGGWEGDGAGAGYAFATAGALLGEDERLVVPVRVTASHLYYQYEDEGGRHSVQAPGGSCLAGLRLSRRAGSVSILAGGEIRRERREPTVGSGLVTVRWRGGFVGQLEGARFEGRFQPQGLLVYSGASRYLYGRGLLRWQVSNPTGQEARTWFLGVEGVGQGNDDVEAVQAGIVAECFLPGARLSVSVRGGAKRAWTGGDRDDGGYAGVGLYRRF